MQHQPLVVLAILTTLFAGCRSTPQVEPADWSGLAYAPDVAISHAPFDVVHIQWKQRLAEPYVYLDFVGDYRQAGKQIANMLSAAKAQAAPLAGPPFILFYDDPAVTPVDQLRARVAIAIDGDFSAKAPLYLDTLPSSTVIYAAIGGPFPDVPRAYPKMFEYLAGRGWAPRTPIREIYLTSPLNTAPEELVTEVQIPWLPGA